MTNIINRSFLQRTLYFLMFGIVIVFLSATITYIANPTIDALPKTGESITRAEGFAKMLAYIENNGIYVPFQMFLLALIPIPFLYALNIIASSISFGIVIGFLLHFPMTKAIPVLLASIPHFLVEFLGFALLASILYLFNRSIRDYFIRLFKKSHYVSLPFLKTLQQTVIIYFLFVLPTIIIAAFLETYVADWLLHILR